MTHDEAVTTLTEALDVPVGDARQLAPNTTDRPLWAQPEAYLMVWPTDTGFDVQVVAGSDERCVELAQQVRQLLGRKGKPAAEQVQDPRRSAWVATA